MYLIFQFDMLPLAYVLNMWNETAEVLAGLFEALLDRENPLDWLLDG